MSPIGKWILENAVITDNDFMIDLSSISYLEYGQYRYVAKMFGARERR